MRKKEKERERKRKKEKEKGRKRKKKKEKDRKRKKKKEKERKRKKEKEDYTIMNHMLYLSSKKPNSASRRSNKEW